MEAMKDWTWKVPGEGRRDILGGEDSLCKTTFNSVRKRGA